MTRRPSMQFYPADFLGGTALMSRAAVGAYIAMLCTSWEIGAIPDTRAALFKAMGLGPDDEFDVLWAEVLPKWTKSTEGWRNARLERVREDRDRFIELQSEKGRRSGAARRAKRTEHEPEPQPKRNRGSYGVGTGRATEHEPEPQPKRNPPISDLRSPSPDPSPGRADAREDPRARVPRATKADERPALQAARRRGLPMQAFIREELEGKSGAKGAKAEAAVDQCVHWALEEISDATVTDDPADFWRRAWKAFVDLKANGGDVGAGPAIDPAVQALCERAGLRRQEIATWFEDVRLEEDPGAGPTLWIPDAATRTSIERMFGEALQHAVQRMGGERVTVRFGQVQADQRRQAS